MQTLIALLPLSVFVWIPAGFAAGYLGSQSRTADLAWFVLSAAALAVGAGCLWFGYQLDRNLEESATAAWTAIGTFFVGGLGLGALSGFLARALGTLGWIIGFAGSAFGLFFGLSDFLSSLAL